MRNLCEIVVMLWPMSKLFGDNMVVFICVPIAEYVDVRYHQTVTQAASPLLKLLVSLGTMPGGSGRLPLFHPTRIKKRDEKMWQREMHLGQLTGKINCSCTECMGIKSMFVKKAVAHQLDPKRGRAPVCRIWQGPDQDSSDEEWARDYISQFGASAARRANLNKCTPGENIVNDSQVQVNSLVDEALVHIDSEGLHVTDDEPEESEPNVHQGDAFDFDSILDGEEGDDIVAEVEQSPVGEESTDPMLQHLRDCTRPLYEGARIDLLSFILMFMNICHTHGFTNGGVNELLSCLAKHVLPEGHCSPRSLYAAKQLLRKSNLHYEKIPACPNGCVLFRKQWADVDDCPVCGSPKKKNEGSTVTLAKVVRYFPIIPRLQRLYLSSTTSKMMTWHHENASTDGLVRHVADSKAWKHVDQNIDPSFASDPRNVRLALAHDGVNPYGNNSTSWSTWPVLLINYNLPPWLQTKKPFVMLSMLFPGPKSVTDEELDVFMQPLLDDLLTLWDGVPSFDVVPRAGMSQSFQLRAILLWTINDYPALGKISGQQHGGKHACVVCGPNVDARRAEALHKEIYLGHRRYLPPGHAFRRRVYADLFDGEEETRPEPPRMSATNRRQWGEETEAYLKNPRAKLDDKECPATKTHGVKRVPCLYQLPYWEVRTHYIFPFTLSLYL